jgi:hypothetical protein
MNSRSRRFPPLNEIAFASEGPGPNPAQMAEVEIRQRVAYAQIEVANEQREAARPQKTHCPGQLIVAAVTLALAIVIFSHQMTR